MSGIDTNVNNYTITELLSILNIDDINEKDIFKKTNQYIDRFKRENNNTLVIFFQEIQTKLLTYLTGIERGWDVNEFQQDNRQTEDWYKNEVLQQSNDVQRNKITDRVQKIDIYDNNHVPMKKEQLGVNNIIDTKIAQDTLNPNLENITTRLINLDSQFRQASGGIDSISTDYTLDLSDPLTDVVSLRLYSVQIPYTWYTIDYQYGNTCFWVTNNNTTFKISISPGNYDPTSFVIELNTSFQTTGFISQVPPVSFNINNGKITINLNEVQDPSGNIINGINNPITEVTNSIITDANTLQFDANNDPYFTFFDFTGEKICQQNCSSQNLAFNNTLGWLMGYRLPVAPIYNSGNIPVAVLDIYGPKYLILVIDDYNQNHINNGLITITEISSKINIPSYYNPLLPRTCDYPKNTIIDNMSNSTSVTENPLLGLNAQNIGSLFQDKLSLGYSKTQKILPTAPRTLTQAQLYTINEIIKNKDKTTSYRGKAPTASDTFALIPVKHIGMKTGDLYVDFSGSLQDNKRIYFGPVDIDRMRIKLLDDRGFLVDLHGSEWCITLISENLYQY
jgi:hypothetical protein